MMADVIYSMPNITKKEIKPDGDRRQREDTEDKVEMEVRVVDIYESADVVLGPQQDTSDDTARRHTQGEFEKSCEPSSR